MGDAQLSAEVADHVDLVLHQGDEWRNDDGRAFRHQCGQLVAKRLAASRGHQYEGVIAAKDAFDDFFLVAFELVEAENILQQLVNFLVIFLCHDSSFWYCPNFCVILQSVLKSYVISRANFFSYQTAKTKL